ncbi:hypothetical protein Y032_0622g755 [Ancylostoma ceylanicum]|uniref:Nematode cuticle collagen N-terminal domain-containing protein n=1 Tax=Ancylostoma ceylanicum TaxID=53326 RepID=A0A016WMJ8_9BILA|nr:hypothetical protein Y032_0622g755 [Ancylostoma ceylanicum]
MLEDKVIVGAASVCSLLAIGACLAVLPSLYYEINEVHDQQFALDACVSRASDARICYRVFPGTLLNLACKF